MSETVIPEGRGKAEAMRTFLATGGGTVLRGSERNPQFRYQKGVLKGKTYDEAMSNFENRWQGASGSIKDKYARMGDAEGVLSPSEMAESKDKLKPVPGVEYGSSSSQGRPLAQGNLGKGAGIAFVNPPRPESRFDRSVPTPPSDLSKGMAEREIASRRFALGQAPTGAAMMDRATSQDKSDKIGHSVNKLTGLPRGFIPGDKLPDGADGGMQSLADTSLKRQQISDSKAGGGIQGRPFTGIGQADSPGSGFSVPRARMLTQDDAESARMRQNKAGGTPIQDGKDATLRFEFGKQQDAAKAEAYRKQRLANPQARKAGSPNFSM